MGLHVDTSNWADYGYTFHEEKADAACEFIETYLKHWKGEWAGQPFEMLPWQRKAVRDIFGWCKPDGYRVINYVYIEIPKKNGKTFFAAALALLLLFVDCEPGAEIYSAAAERDQARLVFNDAKTMVETEEALDARCRVFAKRISHPGTRGFYTAISADAPTKHGFHSHGIIFDELHVQPNRELYDTLVYGIAARRQPLIVMITTAGVYDPESICWEQHDYALKVIKGVLDPPDHSFYAMVFAADPKTMRWEDPETWYTANPSLGVTVQESYLENECKKALAVPAKQSAFKRLHLNIWTQAAEAAIPPEDWEKCNAPPLEISGRPEMYMGMDLSSKIDITALVGLIADTETEPGKVYLDLYAWFWVPEENLHERGLKDRVPYEAWAEAGYIETTEGNVVDQNFIKNKIVELNEQYEIMEIGFDPWNATKVCTELQDDEGFTIVEMRQGYKTLSEPTKGFIAAVAGGRIRHGGNPVLRWMASNLELRKDANDNWAPQKSVARNRIDGMVAAILAYGRADLNIDIAGAYGDGKDLLVL